MLMMRVACRTDKKLLKKFFALPGNIDVVAVSSTVAPKVADVNLTTTAHTAVGVKTVKRRPCA